MNENGDSKDYATKPVLHRWLRYGAAILALCALAIIVLADFGRSMTRGRSKEVAPESRHALYLLFPKNADAGLRRAIIVSGTELSGTGDFGYYDGVVEKHIAREQMSLHPPASPKELAEHVAALNAEVVRWGKETDIREVVFSLDGDRAELTEYLKSGTIDRYSYTIRGNHTAADVHICIGL